MFNNFYPSHININCVVKALLLICIVGIFSGCSTTNEMSSDIEATQSSTRNESLSEAVSAMKSGNNKEARSLLLEVIKKQPGLSNAHVNLAIIFIKEKSYDEAENSIHRALKINPNNYYALNQLGFLYRRKGEFAKSKAAYEKAININSDYAYAHLNLGILFDLYLYDLEKAIEHYKIYNNLTKESDKRITKWIFDLERRLKKSLAQK